MSLSFVSLKAFGDFVIACQALRGMPSVAPAPYRIVAGAHLRPLADAIGFADILFIAGDEGGQVPAAFDVRRRGMLAAARSLVTLRRQLGELPQQGRFVFDRLGWRERLLVPGDRRIALPAAANIYRAYEMLLAARGRHAVARSSSRVSTSRIRSAVIVPASRLASKTIPASTIALIARLLRSYGIEAEVVLLEGDRADVPQDVALRTIERSFPPLIDIVRTADVVISADSLAAHLAELYGTRCFVASPRPNPYWLPASCWSSQAWCLFDDVSPLERSLRSWCAGDHPPPSQGGFDRAMPL